MQLITWSICSKLTATELGKLKHLKRLTIRSTARWTKRQIRFWPSSSVAELSSIESPTNSLRRSSMTDRISLWNTQHGYDNEAENYKNEKKTWRKDCICANDWLILPRANIICFARAVAINPTAEKWIGAIARGTTQGGACFLCDCRATGTAKVKGGSSSEVSMKHGTGKLMKPTQMYRSRQKS